MTRRILVPTIAHTGTHFMRDELLAGREILLGHIWPESIDDWCCSLAAGQPAIIPLRHPVEVARSWKRRGKDVRGLPALWRLLVERLDRYHPSYLTLDQPELRNDQLTRINLTFELDLKTTWPRVAEAGIDPKERGYCVQLDAGETLEILDLVGELAPFLKRWYPPVTRKRLRGPGW